MQPISTLPYGGSSETYTLSIRSNEPSIHEHGQFYEGPSRGSYPLTNPKAPLVRQPEPKPLAGQSTAPGTFEQHDRSTQASRDERAQRNKIDRKAAALRISEAEAARLHERLDAARADRALHYAKAA